MAQASEPFSFIIVGAGPSGCVVASRLASRFPHLRILLLEAGGDNSDPGLLDPRSRYSLPFTHPFMDWSYETVPQSYLDSRILRYSRGKGLGGSSATNYGGWTVGHREEFNEWATLVDDDCWRWDGKHGVQQNFKKIENLHVAKGCMTVFDLDQINNHGNAGMVDIAYNSVLDEVKPSIILDCAKEQGIDYNGDINSGNSHGIGFCPVSFYNNTRVTSKTAYLKDPPPNLHILTNSPVAKIVFNKAKHAIGVQLHSDIILSATNEVIVSAGAIATPHLLLHSGIGPADELTRHSIPIVHDLLGVGENLMEHPAVTTSLFLAKDSTGTASMITSGDFQEPNAIAFLQSSSLLASPEFSALPARTRQLLSKIPSCEVVPGAEFSPFIPPTDPPTPHRTIVEIFLTPQSRGTIKLRSSSPADPPLVDLDFLSHPYDRCGIVEAVRAGLSFQNSSKWQIGVAGVAGGPSSESEEDILEFARKHISASMHPAGSCKMGRDTDVNACVDRHFRVRGVTGLRVVDMSVAPLLGSTHTQSIAYLIGEVAAEKVIEEYSNTAE